MSENPSVRSLIGEHWDLARDLRRLRIHYKEERCCATWQCIEVCPIGCWSPDHQRRKARVDHLERCIACGACVLQCPQDAISLSVSK